MAIDGIFDSASSVMTVISLVTFLGILWWTFVIKRSIDFDAAASAPSADDTDAEANACMLPARVVQKQEHQRQREQARRQHHV